MRSHPNITTTDYFASLRQATPHSTAISRISMSCNPLIEGSLVLPAN
ncbi:MAG: hypothetical protein AAF808_20860 [Cyanobacteria bacterium P01_D01_bin.2]